MKYEWAPIPDRLANMTFTPAPGAITYLGAGGRIKLEVQPGVLLDQLRLARDFLGVLIDLEAKAGASCTNT